MVSVESDVLVRAERLRELATTHKRLSNFHKRRATEAMENRRVLLENLAALGIEVEIK